MPSIFRGSYNRRKNDKKIPILKQNTLLIYVYSSGLNNHINFQNGAPLNGYGRRLTGLR